MIFSRYKIFTTTLLLLFTILFGTFVLGALSEPVHAQTDFGVQNVQDQGLGLSSQPLDVTVVKIIRIVLGFLGLIAVIVVLYGGYVYMTAGGNDDKVSQAKLILRNGVIGFAIILFSFAIVQFILSRLIEATGLNSGDNGNGGGDIGCTDILSCNFNNPCEDIFVAQSITPNQDISNVNNIVIRAVFTKSVGTPAAEIFSILKDSADVTRNFTYEFVPGTDKKVVEAIMPLEGEVSVSCTDGNYADGTECVPLGDYNVSINDTVVATDGEGISFGATACTAFDGLQKASFSAPTEANDVRDPTWQGVGIINPQTNSIFTDAVPRLPAGETYIFVGTADDDNGVAYTHFHVEATDGSETPFDLYRGPTSSADPYIFSKELFFSSGIVRNINAPKQYEYTFTTWDIDHHVSAEYTGKFVLVGNHCFNGVFDENLETSIDVGGACGSDNICTENYQCASGLCVEGQCIAKPQITSVDPMDGAPGNWVTIRGYYFGTDKGTIEFGTEDDGWIDANIVECGDVLIGNSWNNTYVIAEVPNNTAFAGDVTEAAIRITNSESGYQDATNDDFGPMPVYTAEDGTQYPDGLFRFTTTTRPGLCAVVVDGDQNDVPDGVSAGPPGVRIRATGRKFGTRGENDDITFDIGPDDSLAASVFGWEDTLINTIVPLAVAPGNPLVHVVKDGVESNGIPFRVTNPDLSDAKPFISEISPLDPTPGSYITITGAPFGLAGIVYISPNAGAECSRGSTDDSCIELAPPAAPCENTWTDTQIIADLPESFSNYGTYYVTVERADNGLSTDGTEDIISVQNGAPKPSICQLSPNQGPSILPEEHPGLVFEGKNFTRGTTKLYFWDGAGDITNPDDVSNLDSENWISWGDQSGDPRWGVSTDKKRIVSSVGYKEASEHPTMPLGKWPIAVISNGIRGNNIQYFVTDCRLQGSDAGDTSLQCCTEGPDAGSWKTICAGDVRSSGYVWRFTTGIPPEIPYVLVQCSDDGNFAGQDVEASPVPSTEWDESEQMCINATAQVAISTSIDPTTITSDSVLVYTCGSSNNDINCTYTDADKVPDLDLEVQSHTGGSVIVIKKASDLTSPNFEQNTWYRVLLTTDIKSIEQAVGGGNSTSTPLRVDRVPEDFPYSGADVAFYYDFQTGTGLCSLDSAYITPREKTVTQIGPLHDIYNTEQPFYYYLKGKADRKCTILNVDGLGWQWTSDRTDKATITAETSGEYKDTRATAAANEEAADGVIFHADVSSADLGADLAVSFPDGLHADTSTLFINIGPPHVTSYEPNCADSCPNAVIKATFSRHMDPSTYQSGVTVYECTDPNCVNVTDVTGRFSVDTSSKLEVKIRPLSTSLMNPNTYYKVVLSDRIASLGGVNLDVRDGQSLTPFSWVFRTKQDATVCGVDRIDVSPHPFTATYIGQKTKFTATPIGAPNQCNPRGQEIVRTKYTYNWQSTVPAVAATTQFAASLTGSASFCTEACLPAGSDVNFENKNTPICGNGIVDPGEDCDIAMVGESLGLTCTLSCLRPGFVPNADHQTYCGDGDVDNPAERLLHPERGVAGEACDPSASIQTSLGAVSSTLYCTEECLKKGSSLNFNPNTSGYCGDGVVGLEEACDVGIPLADASSPNLSKVGCNTSCLHEGTPLSADWCTAGVTFNSPYISQADVIAACTSAKSICGNGKIEAGEQCEAVNGVLPSYCSNTCTLVSACDTQEAQCDPAVDEGCTSECIYAGSSLFYSTPSVCGDGIAGIGEYASCEIPGAVTSTEQGALQLVTSIGEGQTEDGKQTTTIQSTIPSEGVTGQATYTLQCGFTEYEEPQNGFYNDCVLPTGAEGRAIDNDLGVGFNSCCFYRPVRETQYPAEDAGFGSEAPICRNTYIEVEFSAEVDPKTVTDNAIIARGYESAVNCAEFGGVNVTAEVQAALGLASGSADASGGFWSHLWQGIKQFFRGLITRVFAGNLTVENMQTWCSEGTLTTDVDTPAKKIPLYLSKPIGSQTEHTAYAVVLRGGKVGIQDVYGVGIKNKTSAFTDDAWAFEVGTEICRVDKVVVQPSSYLFSAPNTSADFAVAAITKQGQPIVSTPAYAWRWEWQPQESTIFNIPADSASASSASTKMGSSNVEGSLTAVANAVITADNSTTGNQLGNIMEGHTQLTSMFCENPWPARADDGSWAPYVDDVYHYSFSYCADDGQSGNTDDDLPFLLSNDIDIDDANDDVLKRLLFVSQRNTDALGIQIFANPERLSAASWFAKKFPNAPIPAKISLEGYDSVDGAGFVTGYDAVADQDNYYINALNIVKDDAGNVVQAYSNIYLFTISQAAQAATRNAFQQIIDSLQFNTNLTDYGYCLGYDGVTPDFQNQCNTDFDCLLGPQTVTTEEAQEGICGIGNSGEWQLKGAGVSGNLLSVILTSENAAFVAQQRGGILKTNDAGQTWQTVVPYDPGESTEQIVAASESNIWAIIGGDLYKSVDAGENWSGSAFPGTPLKLSFLNSNNGYLVGTTISNDPVIAKTIDAGQQWTTVLNYGQDERLLDISYVNNTVAVAVGEGGRVYRTVDGGDNWDRLNLDTNDTLYGISSLGKTIWIVGDNGTMQYSEDEGETWVKKKGVGNATITVVQTISKLEAWIVADGVLYRTVDGGESWTAADIPSTFRLNDIYIGRGSSWFVGDNGAIGVLQSAHPSCFSDNDCVNNNVCFADAPVLVPKTYTSAGCSLEKTKLLRDMERLRDVETIQSALGDGPYPSFANGSFRPNYVSSVWSAWGIFGNTLGANMPKDPINVWSGCNPADPQTCWDQTSSTFVCPQVESVYEYKYDKDTGAYTLHVPFEFFKNESQIEQLFAPSFIKDTGAFTTGRECQPGQTYTFTASACGDGIVGPGEQCDPPGSSAVTTRGVYPQSYGSCEETNEQCLHDSACQSKYGFFGKASTSDGSADQKKFVYAKSSGTYCGTQDGGVIVNQDLSDDETYTYMLYSCKNDTSCGERQFYQDNSPERANGVRIYDTYDLGAYDNAYQDVAFSELGDAFANGSLKPTCVPIQDTFVGNFTLQTQNLQCIGAIQEGDVLECATSPQEFALRTCNTSCQWDYGACESSASCGNGRVDPGESCDDGGLNGEYGQCNKQCNGLADAYCGNGQVDPGYEQCDWSLDAYDMYATNADNACSWDCQAVGSYCGDGVIDTADGEVCDLGVDGVSIYNVDKSLSCSTDCRSFGSYCGDGVVNSDKGESCDDRNNINGDGCNNQCQIEGQCPYPNTDGILCASDAMCSYAQLSTSLKYTQGVPNDNYQLITHTSPTQSVCMYNTSIGFQPVWAMNLNAEQYNGFNDTVFPCDTKSQCQDYTFYSEKVPNTLLHIDDKEIVAFLSQDQNFYANNQSNFDCVPLQDATNYVSGDAGSCELTEQAPITSSVPDAPVIPGCGNGVVDSGEQCDPGVLNTKTAAQCSDLGYGQSCTYCSNTCRIETVDSLAYCGNEQIDETSPNVYETCEPLADGSVLLSDNTGNTTIENCDDFDHGTVSCTNSCSVFANNCFDCGINQQGALPLISFVNPIVGKDSQYTTNFNERIRVFLSRVKNGQLELLAGRFFSNLASDAPLFGVVKNETLGDGTRKIATQNICSGVCENGECENDGYFVTFDESGTFDGKDKFSYNVSSQTTSVTNEYITSPSVPQGTIRVVIRWSGEEEGQGANFRGALYSRGFADAFLRGFADAVLQPSHFCTEAKQEGDATVPTQCSSYENGGIYIHKETGLENTFVQATTIDLDAIHTNDEEPVAFVVSQMDGPIYPWRNKNVTVDVYTYHEGQSFNSIYAPTFSYTIKAAANTSSNASARWWHVFNLVPNDTLTNDEIINGSPTNIDTTAYSIVPVQSIETDDCEFHNNIYTNQVDCS